MVAERFTEKMNVEFEDEEFTAVDVESRGSETNKQSNDPPPEFTGTKPSEFKSYRKKVRRRLLFTRTPAQLQGPQVLSRLTGPAWNACDGLEAEEVASDDGANVILDTLADAFQGEHETELFDALEDTFYGPGRKKGRISTTSHFGNRATYVNLLSKEYGCHTKCKDSFCYVERTLVLKPALPS